MNSSSTATLPALRISTHDHQRLRLLVEAALRSPSRATDTLRQLRAELERADVLPPERMPRDVVVMGSRVEIADLESGETDAYTLVFPEQADAAQRRLSVLAPIGTAILGFAAGDTFAWSTPGGTRRLQIRAVEPPGAA